MSYIPARPWNIQPQVPVAIDRSNEFGKELRYALSLRGGGVTDLVTGITQSAISGTTLKPAPLPIGVGRSFNGSSDYAQISLTLPKDTLVVAWYGMTASYNSNDSMYLEYTANGNVSPGWYVDPDNSSGKLSVQTPLGSLVGITRPAAGSFHHYILMMHAPASGAVFKFYIDGVEQGASATGGMGGGFGTNTLNLMCRNGASLFNDGALSDIWIFNQNSCAWTDAKARRLYRNHWQIFKTRPPIYFATTQDVNFDAAGNSGDQAAASSWSGSVSWSGSNRYLAIDIPMLGPGVTVTAMAYGGANCTFIGSKSSVTSFGAAEQWRICQNDSGAPAAGSNTLSVTLSGSIEFAVEWASYTNVHQTSPTEGFNSAQATNAGSAADASVSITSVADRCLIHAVCVANDTSITANQTSRNNISGTLGSGVNEDSTALVTPAGATTMSVTGMGITTTWVIAGHAIRPIGASGTNATLTAASGTFTLTGNATGFNTAQVSASGSYALTGNAAAFNQSMTTAAGSFTETGNAVSFNQTLTAATSSFALTGNDVNLVAQQSYTMTAETGVFSTTFNNANLSISSAQNSGGWLDWELHNKKQRKKQQERLAQELAEEAEISLAQAKKAVKKAVKEYPDFPLQIKKPEVVYQDKLMLYSEWIKPILARQAEQIEEERQQQRETQIRNNQVIEMILAFAS